MKELSPAMRECYSTALRYGSVGEGWRTGTLAALVRREILREWNPVTRRHYLAIDREEAHTLALLANLEYERAAGRYDYLGPQAWEMLICRLRVLLTAGETVDLPVPLS